MHRKDVNISLLAIIFLTVIAVLLAAWMFLQQERPNVLLIVLDTVRADHLSCYGYHRNTSPHIDAFATNARLYKNVLSPSPWTAPSHASFFTGLPSSAHFCTNVQTLLHDDFDTLAEQLRAKGYQTLGLVTNPTITKERGFAQGFDVFTNVGSHIDHRRPLREVVNREEMDARSYSFLLQKQLEEWFDKQYRPAKPFFIFLNYIEPHAPYVPPSSHLRWSTQGMFDKWEAVDQFDYTFRHVFCRENTLSQEDIAELATLYDEEIAYIDGKVGQALELLRKTGNYENTLIIIASDHGEHLGEHGLMEHQFSVYEPLVRVPLIVKYRDRFAAGEEETLVQSHDIYPTILELARVKWKRLAVHNSRSLLTLDDSDSRVAISEYWKVDWVLEAATEQLGTERDFFVHSHHTRDLKAFQIGDMKLVLSSKGESELYDLAKDPLETHDLSRLRPEVLREFHDQVELWRKPFENYKPAFLEEDNDRELSEKELGTMRGMGYIR